MRRFNEDYLELTRQARDSGVAHDLSDECMVIGTSALLSEVNWLSVGSAAVLAGILSLLTSIATGLPEAENHE